MIESFLQGAMYAATIAIAVGLIATPLSPIALATVAAIGGLAKTFDRKPYYTFRR